MHRSTRHVIASVALLAAATLAAASAQAANIAPLGTPTQSSNLSGFVIPGNALLAIDGDRDGNYFHGSVTITNSTDPSPTNDGLFDWWNLDFDQAHKVNNVLLFGRTDCDICLTRIDPFRLELFREGATVFTQDYPTFIVDISTPGLSGTRGMEFLFDNILADGLRITLLQRTYLEIAEVEIYDAPRPVPVPAALPLLVSALAGVGALARRRRR